MKLNSQYVWESSLFSGNTQPHKIPKTANIIERAGAWARAPVKLKIVSIENIIGFGFSVVFMLRAHARVCVVSIQRAHIVTWKVINFPRDYNGNWHWLWWEITITKNTKTREKQQRRYGNKSTIRIFSIAIEIEMSSSDFMFSVPFSIDVNNQNNKGRFQCIAQVVIELDGNDSIFAWAKLYS